MIFNVVTGAPCSGKTTYIAEHKKDGDAVIDFDALTIALGADASHECSPLITLAAKHARHGALMALVDNRTNGYDGDVWIAHALPSERFRQFYASIGAVYHVLNTGRDTCLERAEADGRPQRSIDGIHTYFDKHGTGEGLTLSEMGR